MQRRVFLKTAAFAGPAFTATRCLGIGGSGEDSRAVREERLLPAGREHPESLGYAALGPAYPLVDISGSPLQCGWQLGVMWREILRARAQPASDSSKVWWAQRKGPLAELIDAHAPHVRDIMRGMQLGAGLGEQPMTGIDLGRAPGLQWLDDQDDECTSFAIHPDRTPDGQTLSGQTMDSRPSRMLRRQIVRLRPRGAPALLHVVCPGNLTECEGFSSTGVALWVNSIRGGVAPGGIPESAFGFLAFCMQRVEQIKEMALTLGVRHAHNYVVADKHGGMVSLEPTREGVGVVEPEDQVLVHSNHILTPSLQHLEDRPEDVMQCSIHRYRRLRELIMQEIGHRGHVSAVKTLQFFADHENYPNGLCRHDVPGAVSPNITGCTAIGEPDKGLLHVVRGNPCMNWAVTYTL